MRKILAFGDMSRRPLVKKILANAGWLLTEHGVRLFTGLIVGIFLARYLGPADFGVYRYVLAVAGLALGFSNVGLNSIVSRELLEFPAKEPHTLGTATFIRLSAGILIAIVGIAVFINFMDTGKEVELFVILLLIANIFSAVRVLDYWFEAHLLARYIVKSRSVVLLFFGVVKITLIFLFAADLIYFVSTAAAESVALALAALLIYRQRGGQIGGWRIHFSEAKSLLSKSWPLIISSVAAVMYLKIDQVMLGAMVSTEAVGIYAVAVTLSETWYVLSVAFAASVYPALVKLKQGDSARYAQKLQMSFNVLAVSAMAIAIVVTLASGFLIDFLYGPEYREAAVILSLHIWAAVFIFMRALLSKWLILEGLYIHSLTTHVSGAILNVLFNLLLIPALGGVGAAISTLISYAAASYLVLFVWKSTRPAAMMMTRSLIYPILAVVMLARESNLKP